MPEFKLVMRFLGYEQKTSNKTGSQYMLAKFMSGSTIFEFYIAGDRLALITDVAKLEPFLEFELKLGLKSFNNKPDVELIAIG